MNIKSFIQKLIPPIFFDLMARMNFRKNLKNQLYYFGDFSTWDEALKASQKLSGDYSDTSILDQVDEAIQKVRRGEALYEQDGVCFYQPNNNWELLAAMFYAETTINNEASCMSVLDFGGSLGSTYFRYRNLFDELGIKWHVVEQKHFVERGIETVPEVRFHYTLDEAVNAGDHSTNYVLLLSSVLGYLDRPYEMFEDMLSRDFEYIIIDETAFFIEETTPDRIMLQHVPSSIYSAVYPINLFGLSKFRDFVTKFGYEIFWEWTYRGGFIPIKEGSHLKDTIDKGFFLRKRK